tara:strand:- start:236 stop:709 length:474 start_codon:yes stop_codon:yes gene_type:complete
MKRHAVLTSTFTNEINGFDKPATLSKQNASGVQPEPLRRIARGVLAVAIGILLCIVPDAGSSEQSLNKSYIDYKTYSLYLLDFNYKEYNCLLKLYGKESAWNPLASNGSHYGIPQGKSEWLKDQDGWTQVQWGLDYIGHRYGEPCIALDHWSKYGWH